VWGKFEEEGLALDLEFEKSDFSCTYMLDTVGVLNCLAVIPFKTFDARSLRDINKVSVGIETKPTKALQKRDEQAAREVINGVEKPRDLPVEEDPDLESSWDESMEKPSGRRVMVWFQVNIARSAN